MHKKIFFSFILFFLLNNIYPLNPGDIIFIGWNTDGEENFIFLALTNIVSNQIIYFRDDEYSNSGWFDENEGTIAWQSPDEGINSGTVIHISNLALSSPWSSVGNCTNINGNISLNNSGEILYAYTSSENWKTGAFTFLSAFINSSTFPEIFSNTALTPGSNCWSPGNKDNQAYNRFIDQGSPAVILKSISDYNNWINSDGAGDTSLDFNTNRFLITNDSYYSQLIISEVCDSGTYSSFIELYNQGGKPVLLNGININFYNNGSTLPTQSTPLSGFIYPGEFFVIARDNFRDGHIAFFDAYGFIADLEFPVTIIDPGDAISINNLIKIIDQFGKIPGVEASDEPESEICYQRKNFDSKGEDLYSDWLRSKSQIPGTPKSYNTDGAVVNTNEYLNCFLLSPAPTNTLPGAFNIPFLSMKINSSKKNTAYRLISLAIKIDDNTLFPDIYKINLYKDRGSIRTFETELDELICELSPDYNNLLWEKNNLDLYPTINTSDCYLLLTIDLKSTVNTDSRFMPIAAAKSIIFSNIQTGSISSYPYTDYYGNNYIKIIDPLKSIIINEINWMGDFYSSSSEWIELYNNTTEKISLENWILGGAGYQGNKIIITNKTTINPGSFIVIADSPSCFSNFKADIYTDLSLPNSGERTLYLQDSRSNYSDFIEIKNEWFAGNNTIKSSMERINPLLAGSDPQNWKTADIIKINNYFDLAGSNINGSPGKSNSGYINSSVISTICFPAVGYNIFKGNSNITVYAFRVYDSENTGFKINSFENTGTANSSAINKIKVFMDIDNDHSYSLSDIFIEQLIATSNNIWYGNSNLLNYSNYLITIDCAENIFYGSYFRGYLNKIKTTQDKISSGIINPHPQMFLSKPPLIKDLLISTTNISNQNSEFFSLNLEIKKFDQYNAGVITASITNIYNKEITYLFLNANSNTYFISNAVLPGSIDPGKSDLVIRVWDDQKHAFSSTNIPLIISGFWNPQIIYFKQNSTKLLNTGTENIQINLTVFDPDSFTNIKKIEIDFSSLNEKSNCIMYNISGNTNWQISKQIPKHLTPGLKNIAINIKDYNSGQRTTNIDLSITAHSKPICNAGTNLIIHGGNKVNLNGTVKTFNQAFIESYNWRIEQNGTNYFFIIENKNHSTAFFQTPNIDENIICSFQAIDNYGYVSDLSFVEIKIKSKHDFAFNLDKFTIKNTVITRQHPYLSMCGLSIGSQIFIYTINNQKISQLQAINNSLTWKVPNNIAPGIYFICIRDLLGNSKTSKVVIIR